MNLLSKLERSVAVSGDSPEQRTQKSAFLAYAFAMIPIGFTWGGLYAIFGEPLAALIPSSYAVFVFFSIALYLLTRNYRLFVGTELFLVLLLPFVLQVVLGGFVNSSAVILWSLTAPFEAFVFAGRRQAVRWGAAYVFLVVLSGLVQPYVRLENNLSLGIKIWFFVINIIGVSLIAIALINYYIGQRDRAYSLLDREQQKTESLLLNVLPRKIAAILKNESRIIADRHEHVSILFADMVGFTPLSIQMTPEETVSLLNEIFSRLDELVEQRGLEKIRTIGDNYMVVSGAPGARADHAQALADFALELRNTVKAVETRRGYPIQFRVGINSGQVVAGVIGRRKFHYDVWGDAVNLASRMESHSEPDRIQIAQSTYELIKEDFLCQPRGEIEIKGVGRVLTWFLIARKGSAVPLH